jgi:TonB family protein
MQRKRRNWLVRALVWSSGVHGAIFLVAVAAGHRAKGAAPEIARGTFVEVVVPDEKAKEIIKDEKLEKLKNREIVDIPRPLVERRPKKARFVSEFNSSVPHETQDLKDGAEPAPTIGSLTPPPPSEQSARRRAHDDDAVHHTPVTTGAPVADDADLPVPVEQPLKKADGPAGDRALPELTKLDDTGGGSLDHPDVEAGDTTALNTDRWLAAAYFNRIKRAVRHEWNPPEQFGANDPLAAAAEHTTELRIVLDPDGALVSCDVLRSSGNRALDSEAVDAVARAAPFRKPPRQVVGADHRIRCDYNFTLHLKLGR